ncbi:MAG: CBS domain-containing protein, partial [Candidatus Aenigmatarchaeota archaeon]
MQGRNGMSVELEKAGLDRFKKIVEFANLHPIHCSENDPISSVVQQILKTTHRSFPVVTKGEMIGVVTIMDILGAFLRRHYMDDKISEIMSRDVIYCNSNDPIGFVLQKFKLTRRGRFPILEKKRLVGIVTERDFVKRFSKINFGMTVQEKMTNKPFFMEHDASILSCLRSCVNTRYRRLPIVNNRTEKKLVGIITVSDILRFIADNNYDYTSLIKPVDSIMIKNVFQISADEDISNAIKIIDE